MGRRVHALLGLVIAAGCSLLLSEGDGSAQDKKIFGGGACVAKAGADQENLKYGGGVLNIGSFTNVMCPLYRDDTLNEDGFNYLELRVNKQSADAVSCTANCASFQTEIESDGEQAAAGSTEVTLVFDAFDSAQNGQCQVACGLPSGAGIRYYEWHE